MELVIRIEDGAAKLEIWKVGFEEDIFYKVKSAFYSGAQKGQEIVVYMSEEECRQCIERIATALNTQARSAS